MQTQSHSLTQFLQIPRKLFIWIDRIRAWYRAQPDILLATPENLKRPLKSNQRRLVVHGKILIFTDQA